MKDALPLAAALALLLGAAGAYVNLNEAKVEASFVARIPHISEIHDALHVLYAWSSIVLLMALAQRYFDRPSRALTYLTGAVFCYYILHQTIIIFAGYYLTQLQLGAAPEFMQLVVITVAGCAAGYELLRRIPGVRIWFGIRGSESRAKQKAAFSTV